MNENIVLDKAKNIEDYQDDSSDKRWKMDNLPCFPEKFKFKLKEDSNKKIDSGVLKRGIIIRHLILPNNYKDSFKILEWVKENLGTKTYISIIKYSIFFSNNKCFF